MGRVTGKPFWFDPEPQLGPLDHRARCADFGLANGACRFDIHGDAVLCVDQIVVGVSNECLILHRPRPLRGWIGARDELWRHVTRSSEGVVVQGIEILAHGPAGSVPVSILVPVLSRYRAALVGIGLDQARVHREPFAANELLLDAIRHNMLEQVTQQIALAKAFIAGTRKRGMIGPLVFEAEPAEPAVGKIDLHLAHELTFRANGKDITQDQHAQHEFWIDRRSAGVGIVRRQCAMYPAKVKHASDLTNRVIVRHRVIQVKCIKELLLIPLKSPHHRKAPAMPAIGPTESRFARHLNESFATALAPSRHGSALDLGHHFDGFRRGIVEALVNESIGLFCQHFDAELRAV